MPIVTIGGQAKSMFGVPLQQHASCHMWPLHQVQEATCGGLGHVDALLKLGLASAA